MPIFRYKAQQLKEKGQTADETLKERLVSVKPTSHQYDQVLGYAMASIDQVWITLFFVHSPGKTADPASFLLALCTNAGWDFVRWP